MCAMQTRDLRRRGILSVLRSGIASRGRFISATTASSLHERPPGGRSVRRNPRCLDIDPVSVRAVWVILTIFPGAIL